MTFIHISHVLGHSIRRAKIEKPVNASLIIRSCQQLFDEHWPHLADDIRPRAITWHDGVVTIRTGSAAVAAAVRLQEHDFIRTINTKFSPHCVINFKYILR